MALPAQKPVVMPTPHRTTPCRATEGGEGERRTEALEAPSIVEHLGRMAGVCLVGPVGHASARAPAIHLGPAGRQGGRCLVLALALALVLVLLPSSLEAPDWPGWASWQAGG
ncbi:hypothetical protein LA080_013797 [Diaporthe eres]|nr:hypothetical protein LA080_013797 [Diaporthe eres]